MGNFLFANITRRIILCACASSVLLVSLPIKAENHYERAINLNDIAFIARIQSLIERIEKYRDRLEEGKIINTLLDLKMEVEAYTGKHIDIGKGLKEIEKQCLQRGAKLRPDEMKRLREGFRKYEKKHNHKAVYLYDCNLYDIPYVESEYQMILKAVHKPKEREEEQDNPIRLTVGTVCALAGYFLSYLPHPYCQTASKFLMTAGVTMAAEGIMTRLEEDKKKVEQEK